MANLVLFYPGRQRMVTLSTIIKQLRKSIVLPNRTYSMVCRQEIDQSTVGKLVDGWDCGVGCVAMHRNTQVSKSSDKVSFSMSV